MADLADRSKSDTQRTTGRGFSSRLVELLVAIAVVALGVVILWQTGEIRDTPTAQVSARLFPRIIGVGTILVGIWYAVDVLRGDTATPATDSEDVDPTMPTDWRCVAFLGVSLAIYLLLIERAGFIIASVALFVITAYGMGSRRYLRDIAIAILLATAVYYGFAEGLGVRLPEGIPEEILSN